MSKGEFRTPLKLKICYYAFNLLHTRTNIANVTALNISRCTVILQNTVELGYNVTTRTEYFASLYTGLVITEEYNIMVNSGEVTVTTRYLTL
jgi:hypothetical protein